MSAKRLKHGVVQLRRDLGPLLGADPLPLGSAQLVEEAPEERPEHYSQAGDRQAERGGGAGDRRDVAVGHEGHQTSRRHHQAGRHPQRRGPSGEQPLDRVLRLRGRGPAALPDEGRAAGEHDGGDHDRVARPEVHRPQHDERGERDQGHGQGALGPGIGLGFGMVRSRVAEEPGHGVGHDPDPAGQAQDDEGQPYDVAVRPEPLGETTGHAGDEAIGAAAREAQAPEEAVLGQGEEPHAGDGATRRRSRVSGPSLSRPAEVRVEPGTSLMWWRTGHP